MGEAIEDFSDFDQLSQGFTSVDPLKSIYWRWFYF